MCSSERFLPPTTCAYVIGLEELLAAAVDWSATAAICADVGVVMVEGLVLCDLAPSLCALVSIVGDLASIDEIELLAPMSTLDAALKELNEILGGVTGELPLERYSSESDNRDETLGDLVSIELFAPVSSLDVTLEELHALGILVAVIVEELSEGFTRATSLGDDR